MENDVKNKALYAVFPKDSNGYMHVIDCNGKQVATIFAVGEATANLIRAFTMHNATLNLTLEDLAQALSKYNDYTVLCELHDKLADELNALKAKLKTERDK